MLDKASIVGHPRKVRIVGLVDSQNYYVHVTILTKEGPEDRKFIPQGMGQLKELIREYSENYVVYSPNYPTPFERVLSDEERRELSDIVQIQTL